MGANEPGDEALVAVDVRREQHRELARVGEQSREEVLEDLREAVFAIAREDRLVVLVTQREVDVAGVALALVVLRHEGEAHALLGGDLLRAELEQAVLVGLLDERVVPEGDLVLPEVAFALRRLDDHAGRAHRATDSSEQWLNP